MKTAPISFVVMWLLVGGMVVSAQEGSPKVLAPGVMRTVRPFLNFSETYQWSSMPDLIAADPSNDWAKDLYFNKEIWCLEFHFKPIRLIDVDFPSENGRLARKTVWYMVYSVTNTGRFLKGEIDESGRIHDVKGPADTTTNVMVRKNGELAPEPIEQRANNLNGIYEPTIVDYLDAQPDESGKIPGTVRFSPRFALVGHDVTGPVTYTQNTENEPAEEKIGQRGVLPFFRLDRTEGGGFYFSQPIDRQTKVYNDPFLPLALARIIPREDPNQRFENSVTMPAVAIKPGETVWGIATWTDVDPRIDRLTVYVSGLTNATRWEQVGDVGGPNDSPMAGREVFRKVLKVNFYRPGDEHSQGDEIFYDRLPGQEDFEWVYL